MIQFGIFWKMWGKGVFLLLVVLGMAIQYHLVQAETCEYKIIMLLEYNTKIMPTVVPASHIQWRSNYGTIEGWKRITERIERFPPDINRPKSEIFRFNFKRNLHVETFNNLLNGVICTYNSFITSFGTCQPVSIENHYFQRTRVVDTDDLRELYKDTKSLRVANDEFVQERPCLRMLYADYSIDLITTMIRVTIGVNESHEHFKALYIMPRCVAQRRHTAVW